MNVNSNVTIIHVMKTYVISGGGNTDKGILPQSDKTVREQVIFFRWVALRKIQGPCALEICVFKLHLTIGLCACLWSTTRACPEL